MASTPQGCELVSVYDQRVHLLLPPKPIHRDSRSIGPQARREADFLESIHFELSILRLLPPTLLDCRQPTVFRNAGPRRSGMLGRGPKAAPACPIWMRNSWRAGARAFFQAATSVASRELRTLVGLPEGLASLALLFREPSQSVRHRLARRLQLDRQLGYRQARVRQPPLRRHR